MGLTLSNNKKIYITYTYRDKEFNKDLIRTCLKTNYINKPEEAFWGSPENAEYSWKDWCKSEDYGDYNFDHPIRWKLKDGSKIYTISLKSVTTINGINKISRYLTNYCGSATPVLNYRQMRKDNIAAVELLDARVGHLFINKLEVSFNGWDCNSIVVLDPSKIVFL